MICCEWICGFEAKAGGSSSPLFQAGRTLGASITKGNFAATGQLAAHECGQSCEEPNLHQVKPIAKGEGLCGQLLHARLCGRDRPFLPLLIVDFVALVC